MTYGTHPHSRRSRRVHRARDVRGPLSLTALVIVLIWAPAVGAFFFLATGSLIHHLKALL